MKWCKSEMITILLAGWMSDSEFATGYEYPNTAFKRKMIKWMPILRIRPKVTSRDENAGNTACFCDKVAVWTFHEHTKLVSLRNKLRSIRLVWVTLVALQILLNDKYKLNHCKEMGEEPGRRFLIQTAAKLEPELLLSIRRGESQPLVLPLKWSGHQLKTFERHGMTYELLLDIFSMKKLISLLYRNCSANFFTVPPELTRVGMLDFFRCTLRSVANHVIAWDKTTLNAEGMFCQSEVPNGRCDLCSLNSVVAVFSGGVTIVKNFVIFNFCNPEF